MDTSNRIRPAGPKCAALVGPMSSGKTTLLEAILHRTGAIHTQNTVSSGHAVGDVSPEARAHGMSIEATVATTTLKDEPLTLIDCPGSVEFAHEAAAVLKYSDFAIVVVEPDPKKLPALQLVLHQLDELGLPRIMFLNKIDKAEGSVQQTLQLLQTASRQPLLLRQIPIRENGIATGCIDLALERAYIYRPHEDAEVREISSADKPREEEARFAMLETLADHDDTLMEQLLEDIHPDASTVFNDLTAELRDGLITPVLIGSAENATGILRLLKTIRHDCPNAETTRVRLGLEADAGFAAGIMKTIHTTHAGKLSVARILSGQLGDGDIVITGTGAGPVKVSGINTLLGKDTTRAAAATAGETVALGKLEGALTGDVLVLDKTDIFDMGSPARPALLYAIGIRPEERRDEVKLSSALARLLEEDPSLKVEHNQTTGETVLHGAGEMHLRIALERLENRAQIKIHSYPPSIDYRETISKPVTQRGRHKKQSGGHGQYGDVVLDIRPQAPGTGFEFTSSIVGGAVPKQFIGSVEAGVKEYLQSGPLGFPVVDVAVNLTDGSYHTVDSSDMAFQLAGKLAMREGMPQCGPVLLEPVMKVAIHTPADSTANVTAMVPQRRGQILGFEPRDGWQGWDTVTALIPHASLRDMIIELRSATAGAATYDAAFDHMQKLDGRLADEVINARSERLAG